MELTDEAKDWKHIILTPIKEADDGSNNYNEFKRKSMFELDAAGYWKYIDGVDYNPPQIPILQPTREMRGLDLAGNPSTFRIPGNEAEVQAARDKAKGWLEGDKKALAIIVRAVPVEKLYLLEECTSAHAAWKALKNEYEPTNTLSALTIMQQIIGNQCKLEDNPVAWLEVMVRLYGRLRDADPKMMSDWDFAKHLITLMTRDENWRYCRDELRNKLRVAEIAGRTFSSQSVVRRLKDEEVELGIAPYIASLNTIMTSSKGKNVDRANHQAVPGVYTANEFVNNASGSRYLQRDDRKFKPYPNQKPPGNRSSSTFNSSLICENPFCLVNIRITTTVQETYIYRRMLESLHDEGMFWKELEEEDQQVE
ncbi:hypothetical protein C8R42DRAFT_649202 [Lentinula raphanica]|nr:hypothetical protein C8R42DRAFT_649202 [Lentinula raphanica]